MKRKGTLIAKGVKVFEYSEQQNAAGENKKT
jgi:hypothetical protein